MRNRTLGSAALICAVTGGLMVTPTLAAAEEWEFMIAPLFLWAQGIEGSSTINGNEAPLDLDFKDDVLENLEMAFSVHFEARKGDWTFFTEYNYVDLNPDVEASQGPLTFGADVTFKEHLFEAGGAWAINESDATRWELLFGGRYIDQEIKANLEISGPLPPELPGKRFNGGDDWAQGFAGMRVLHALSDRWLFTGRLDYGFGGSDNSAVNFLFKFDYRFNDWGAAFIGGKFMTIDYEERSYGFDADRAGPVMGIAIHW